MKILASNKAQMKNMINKSIKAKESDSTNESKFKS